MASKKRPELDQSATIAEIPRACADEAEAVAFFERKRWGETPGCVHCGSTGVYQMKDRATGERSKRFLWRCRDCGKQYTVRTGSILEESLIPLHKWAHAFWAAASAKNGVSALELSRRIQVSYKTALFVMHRIRWAMHDDPANPPKLNGTVEADETFVGGKPRHKGWKHGPERQPRAQWTTKVPVVACVQRGGQVRARPVARVTADTLQATLRDFVEPGSKVMTDEKPMYRKAVAPIGGTHGVVNHGRDEYVNRENPDIHTNTIEGFFSRVKRQLNGTYHAVSKEHLHRYIAHAQYLYNARTMNDGERVVDLIGKAEGKRLRYEV